MTGDFDMDKAHKGFTLIELVVVITILGIRAAFANPRFAALEVEARIATIKGLEGSVRSAATLAHSLWLVQGSPGTVTMEGNVITMTNGYPDDDNIDDTLVDITGFGYVQTTGIFSKDGSPGVCQVTYAESTGANLMPTIGTTTSGC